MRERTSETGCTSMNVELELTDAASARPVMNLWPLYVHEVAEYGGGAPNRHGVLIDDDSVATLDAQGALQRGWWQRPGVLFPYLICVDGRPAGFDLVAARPFLPPELDVDFVVYEFFVLHPFRGADVAQRAAELGFRRHPGTWEVVTYPSHARAIRFWRRTIAAAARPGWTEEERDHPWGRKVVFRFAVEGEGDGRDQG